MATERLCFVLIQMLRNGADDLVKAAVINRVAELLGYTDRKIEIVIEEQKSRIKWTNFDGILIRFDEPATEAELVHALIPHRFRDQYLAKLDKLLYQPRSRERKQLLEGWNRLSTLAVQKEHEAFAAEAALLIDWIVEHIATRIVEV